MYIEHIAAVLLMQVVEIWARECRQYAKQKRQHWPEENWTSDLNSINKAWWDVYDACYKIGNHQLCRKVIATYKACKRYDAFGTKPYWVAAEEAVRKMLREVAQ